MKLRLFAASALMGCTLAATGAFAKVTTEQAATLGGENLSPMGAEVKGNADGSIPAWTGAMRGLPEGLKYSGAGDIYPDPFGNETPLFTITAQNMAQYEERLSEGQKALFKKYPDSYKVNVYPSHRDGRYSEKIEARTKWNATNTVLVNGEDGLQQFTGGAPFPIPSTGAQTIWNARIIHPHPTIVGQMDDIAVYLDGKTQKRRQSMVSEFPFAYEANEIGTIDDAIGTNAGLVHVTIEEPKRQKGQMTVVHEALDQVKNERKAWVYIPGARRVRRAPTVGYDTPDGPGGLVTVDDSLGFNGALDRFTWNLVGKKEVYIPYHAYKFDDPKVKYDTLLMKGHANPDYMRYELHRVWIVEADLKEGQRHEYGKRRFYIDEDSWQIVLLESYDRRGELWRVGILNTLYDYSLQGFVARAQMFHDLQSGAYLAMRLVNETAPVNFSAEPKGEAYYSPSNLRKMGR